MSTRIDIKQEVSSGWTRPKEWLPLPTVTASDNKLVGLFLVFENESNTFSHVLTANAVNIDYGDGTSIVSNGATQYHVYDYSTITSDVKQYYDGRNYKQVIVTLEYSGTGTWTYCNLYQNYGINNGGQTNFVDIAASLPDVIGFYLSGGRKMTILEQLKVYNIGDLSSNSWFAYMYKLQSLEFRFDKFTNMINPTFSGISVFEDIDLSNALSTQIGFSGGYVERVGNINASSATSIVRMFENCLKLQYIESIDVSSCTNIQQAFNSCYSLNSVTLNNCGNITNTLNAFNAALNLSHLILDGITVGFSVISANMDAASIDAMFTALGMASGSQTVTVTGNPGAATCDVSIATAKGWTVAT